MELAGVGRSLLEVDGAGCTVYQCVKYFTKW